MAPPGAATTTRPEITGRIALKPLSSSGTAALRNFQIGVSGAGPPSTPRTSTSRSRAPAWRDSPGETSMCWNTTPSSACFKMWATLSCRRRSGLVHGAPRLCGRVPVLKYTELETVSQGMMLVSHPWYLSGAYCLTGEHFSLAGGTVNPIHPNRFFEPKKTPGGLHSRRPARTFHRDEDWITEGANISWKKRTPPAPVSRGSSFPCCDSPATSPAPTCPTPSGFG